ncbi:MAG TPA: NUDIX hydrolase [Solirubrobacterales bacterium]|nr:NUDIX hydrolase [Solirubrobacterales bacterium]
MEERRRGPAELPNFGPPSTPRPAASIVLLRRGGKHSQRALEVLLLRRSEEAKFMPGVWVFPGGSLDAADGENEAGLRACALRELAEEAGIELDAGEELVPFSRWITPEVIATRFDAWFFLALAPPHTPPRPDGIETTEARWFQPREALEAEEVVLSFPTRTQLGWLAEFDTSDETMAAYRERTVEPILPKVLADEGAEPRVVLPGDPDYPA